MKRYYWSAKLVSKGPDIGVMTLFGPPLVEEDGRMVELDRSPRWQAIVRTEKFGRAILMGNEVPIEVDGVILRNIEKISQSDYEFLVSHAGWATQHSPTSPDASPTKAINWNKSKVPF